MTKALTSDFLRLRRELLREQGFGAVDGQIRGDSFQFQARRALGGFNFGFGCGADFLGVALRYVADAFRFRCGFALRGGAQLRDFLLQTRELCPRLRAIGDRLRLWRP